MTLDGTTIERIRELVARPEVAERLKNITDLEAAAAEISRLVKAEGIAIAAEEILEQVRAESQQAPASAALTDAQLESIAGGGSEKDRGAWAGISVLTVGVGCAIASAVFEARAVGGCAASLGGPECGYLQETFYADGRVTYAVIK